MDYKIRDTLLPFSEISECYTDIVTNAFSDDELYDPLIHRAVENVTFFTHFIQHKSDEEEVNIDNAFNIEPEDCIWSAECDSDFKKKLVYQWFTITDCANKAIDELKAQERNKNVDELFAALTSLINSAQELSEKVDIEQLNKNIKKFTPNALVKEYNKAEEKKSAADKEDNIIPIKPE